MGVYKAAVVTESGQNLIAQAFTSEKKLIFTSAKTSSYSYPAGTNISALTGLQDVVQSVIPSGTKTIGGNVAQVTVRFDNDSIDQAYLIQTIGLYAKIEDGEEILFSVTQATVPDEMPVHSEVSPSAYIYNIQSTVQNASQITITVNPTGAASVQDFLDIQNPTFDDSGTSEEISSFPEFLDTVKSKMNFFQFFRNLKAGLQFVLHVGSIVNNCVTDNPNLPLSAAQGKALQDQLATLNSNLMTNNAGAHNAIYRGKSLGSTVTTAQYAAIKAGTFDDLYIGDYWTIGGVNYRIAAFDYYFNSGDTSCTAHHVVIVPDTCLYNAQMHNTSSGGYEGGAVNTTTGGYVGSDMYKSNLEQAKTTIKSAFSGHVLKHRIYLTNAVANGRASGGAWCNSEVDLMCEQMVYGSGIFSSVSDGSNVPANYRVEKSQLPLFQHEPSRICNRATWWLRDVITASNFAIVHSGGNAACGSASTSSGVRPAFCIS